jgi:hypothetical protein
MNTGLNTMEIVINTIAIAKNYTKKDEIKTENTYIVTLENGEKKARIAINTTTHNSTWCKAFYTIITNNKTEKNSPTFAIVGEHTIEKYIRSLIEDLD